jgi:hypothetical protein
MTALSNIAVMQKINSNKKKTKRIFSVFSIIAAFSAYKAIGNGNKTKKKEGSSIVTDSGKVSRGSKRHCSQY